MDIIDIAPTFINAAPVRRSVYGAPTASNIQSFDSLLFYLCPRHASATRKVIHKFYTVQRVQLHSKASEARIPVAFPISANPDGRSVTCSFPTRIRPPETTIKVTECHDDEHSLTLLIPNKLEGNGSSIQFNLQGNRKMRLSCAHPEPQLALTQTA